MNCMIFPRTLLAVAVLAIASGCERKSACEKNGAEGRVAADHAHEITIPADHIKRRIGGSYALKHGADHEHVVSLSDAQIQQLAEQGNVTILATSVKGHTHSIEVRCRN
jgi:hypothetical protein